MRINKLVGWSAALSMVCACSTPAPEENKGSASATATAPPPVASSVAASVVSAVSAPASVASGTASALESNAVRIDNLNIVLQPPGATTGSMRDMGEQRSILRFQGHSIQVTIGPGQGELKHMKEKRSKEKGFVKWVTETDDSAIAEMDIEGKKEYYGFSVKKVRGIDVECGTLTMARRSAPSLDAVKKALALCDGLR